ncbi:MAG: hypothetical protein ACYC7B_12405, partial [Burkholderiales bacterium]
MKDLFEYGCASAMHKSNYGSVWFLHKIPDCVRTDSGSYAIGDPRGRAAVRASSSAAVRSIVRRLPTSASGHCALRAPTGHCALRAPTVFS